MTLADRVADIVGRPHVLTDPHLRASYEQDWTGRYTGTAAFVVRPATRAQVADVLRLCHAAGVPVIPQGGNTGLVGGAIPTAGAVVLSTRRLTTLDPVDPMSRQVTAGAGVTLAALQDHAAQAGFDFAIDTASRDSATVGGLVSTNAGGLRVLRWGPMRSQVAGIEAVLPDGNVVGSLAGLDKDSTGYDLAHALVGAEGTLAVITAVRLRLIPRLTRRATATLALPTTEAAVAAVAHLRTLPTLTSAEVFYPNGLRLVCDYRKVAPPFAELHPVYLLVECTDTEDPTEPLADAVAALPDVTDTALATDEPSRRTLWTHREGHTESIASLGTPLKLDVAVPTQHIVEFERRTREITHQANADLYLFGHLAEGNFHVNILDGDYHHLTDRILRTVADLGGTISAEHGIGRSKAPWLHLTRNQAERSLYAAIKHAWDPAGILNPGILAQE